MALLPVLWLLHLEAAAAHDRWTGMAPYGCEACNQYVHVGSPTAAASVPGDRTAQRFAAEAVFLTPGECAAAADNAGLTAAAVLMHAWFDCRVLQASVLHAASHTM